MLASWQTLNQHKGSEYPNFHAPWQDTTPLHTLIRVSELLLSSCNFFLIYLSLISLLTAKSSCCGATLVLAQVQIVSLYIWVVQSAGMMVCSGKGWYGTKMVQLVVTGNGLIHLTFELVQIAGWVMPHAVYLQPDEPKNIVNWHPTCEYLWHELVQNDTWAEKALLGFQ